MKTKIIKDYYMITKECVKELIEALAIPLMLISIPVGAGFASDKFNDNKVEEYNRIVSSGNSYWMSGWIVTVDGVDYDCMSYKIVDEFEASGDMVLGIGSIRARGKWDDYTRVNLYDSSSFYRKKFRTIQGQEVTARRERIRSRHPKFWVK